MRNGFHPVLRLLIAAVLNGALVNLALVLYRRGVAWEEWIFGASVIAGLCVVPMIFRVKRDGARAGVGEVSLRNAIAWLLGVMLPLEITYSIVVRPPRPTLTIAFAIIAFFNGALFGWMAWGLHHAFWPKL